jgi:hypothetical protein
MIGLILFALLCIFWAINTGFIMSHQVSLDGSNCPFTAYKEDRNRRKVDPENLQSQVDQIFKKKRETPVSQKVVDAVVKGSNGDLFSGFSPNNKV